MGRRNRSSVIWLVCVAVTGFPVAAGSHDLMGQNPLSFPSGGIDPWGYMNWPGRQPEAKVDQLVEAGRTKEAFAHCFKRLDDPDPDRRLFFATKAASLGYQSMQTHLVASALLVRLQKNLDAVKGAGTRSRAVHKLPKQDLLAYSFARSVCDWRAGADPERPYEAWTQQRSVPFNFGHEADQVVKATTFASTHSRYIKAVWLWMEGDRSLARQVMQALAEHELADDPRPKMALVRFRATGGAPGSVGEMSREKSDHFMDTVRKRWPKYDRGIYYDGLRCFRTRPDGTKENPELGKRLLRQYLELGTGPEYELRNAKRFL